jgi:hypothetical protein
MTILVFVDILEICAFSPTLDIRAHGVSFSIFNLSNAIAIVNEL